MDAIELLKSDHDKVNMLFKRFEQGGSTQEFDQLYSELDQELSLHANIEEQIFYPAVRQYPELADLVKEAYQEHAEAKQKLSQIKTLDNTSAEWGQQMTALMQAIQHHVQEEESEMFPKVREVMDQDQLQQLGQQLQQAKSGSMMDQQPMMDTSQSQYS